MSVLKSNLRSLGRRFAHAAHRLGANGPAEPVALRADRRPFVPDGHVHSPVVDIDQVERDQERIWPAAPEPAGIDFNRDGHERFLAGPLAQSLGEFEDLAASRATAEAPAPLDARVLFAMLRALRPSRMIAVGPGDVAALAAEVNRRCLGGAIDLTWVAPAAPAGPHRRGDGLTRVIAKRAQDLRGLHRELSPGDVLALDTSHVAKTGSDVNHLYFEVLPRLAPGVVVQVQDIFLPLDYPKPWVFGGRSWNEQYLVRAMLAFTHSFRVLFSCAYARHAMRPALSRALGGAPTDGQALWLVKLEPSLPGRDPGRESRGW